MDIRHTVIYLVFFPSGCCKCTVTWNHDQVELWWRSEPSLSFQGVCVTFSPLSCHLFTQSAISPSLPLPKKKLHHGAKEGPRIRETVVEGESGGL